MLKPDPVQVRRDFWKRKQAEADRLAQVEKEFPEILWRK